MNKQAIYRSSHATSKFKGIEGTVIFKKKSGFVVFQFTNPKTGELMQKSVKEKSVTYLN